MGRELIKQYQDTLIIYEEKNDKSVLTYYIPNDHLFLEIIVSHNDNRLAVSLVSSNGDDVDEERVEFDLEKRQLIEIDLLLRQAIGKLENMERILDLIYKLKELKKTGIDSRKAFEIVMVTNLIESGLNIDKAFQITRPSLITLKDVMCSPIYIQSVVKGRVSREFSTPG